VPPLETTTASHKPLQAIRPSSSARTFSASSMCADDHGAAPGHVALVASGAGSRWSRAEVGWLWVAFQVTVAGSPHLPRQLWGLRGSPDSAYRAIRQNITWPRSNRLLRSSQPMLNVHGTDRI
jgi:hypothetical protein